MWHLISRLLLAAWFIGMVGMTVWNGRGAAAQAGGNTLYLPITYHTYDLTLRDYRGLVSVETGNKTAELYTLRADTSDWNLLVDDAYASPYAWSWAPDGSNFVYITGFGTEDESLNLVPLDTRQPQRIATGDILDFFYWSPDSRYISFSLRTGGTTILQVYDTNVAALYSIPIQSTAPYGVPTPVWSPDSQAMAWWHFTGDGDKQQIGVWNTLEAKAHLVYSGDSERSLYWSPDSTRLLFTANSLTEGYGIYASDTEGTPATMLVPDYSMEGWLNQRTQLLIRQATSYFLADPDGSNLTFFRSWFSRTPRVSIAPTGEYVAFTDHSEVQQNAIVQATDSLTPTALLRCRGIYFRWQPEGNRFVCDSNDSYIDGYEITLGHTTLNPPELVTLHPYNTPRFIQGSTTYLVTQKMSTGYPARLEGTFFYNLETGVFKQIQLPNYERIRVWEWRYMP